MVSLRTVLTNLQTCILCTRGIIPPSLALPAPTQRLYLVPLFKATESSLRAGMCLNPVQVPAPWLGTQPALRNGLASGPREDNPSPTPGKQGIYSEPGSAQAVPTFQ